ncbi:hypothetical protein cypCar_00036925 [Cyprinus carpio]|nr:hypothetical protein cypCar_00036925 [Cyprinus carpio]
MPVLAEEEVEAQEWEAVSLHALEGIVNPAVWVPGMDHPCARSTESLWRISPLASVGR